MSAFGMLGAVSFEAHMPTALAELHLGSHSFLLQDYYVEQWAGNFVMHMLVTNLDMW